MAVVGHFSVLDRKSEQYFPVFTAKNFDIARRTLVQSLTKDSVLVQYPSDFSLVHLCNFNDETGEIIALFGDFPSETGDLVDLIPESLQQFALDGSFKSIKKN